MAEEITLIPKDYRERHGLKITFSKVGIFIFVLVIFTLLIYGGLFFYSKSLNKQIGEVQSKIEELNKQKDKEFEIKAKSLDEALASLKIIFKNHLYWSNLFAKFENLTVPQVMFSNFRGDLKDDGSVSITLKGTTSSYTYLAKQMVSFSQNSLVSDVAVSGINISTQGGLEFNLIINFLKDILIKK